MRYALVLAADTSVTAPGSLLWWVGAILFLIVFYVVWMAVFDALTDALTRYSRKWYFARSSRLKRRLRRTPVRALSRLAVQEPARVVGTVQPIGKTLTAPLTGRKCLYYRAEVEESRRGKYLTSILTESQGVVFAIHDGTGRALVDPNQADLVIHEDPRGRSGRFRNANPELEAFLVRHGQRSQGRFFNRSLRCYEAVIEVDERIAVLGSLRQETRPRTARSAGLPALPRLPQLTGSRECRLVISDSPATMHPN